MFPKSFPKFTKFIEPRCFVENEEGGAAPTGDDATTSEWSTVLLPTKVRVIFEVWRKLGWQSLIMKVWSFCSITTFLRNTHLTLRWRHNRCDSVSNHSLTIVYSTVYSDADQRKHQSSASLAYVWGIHRGPVNSPHKWPVTRKMFPFDDVIMRHRIAYPLKRDMVCH